MFAGQNVRVSPYPLDLIGIFVFAISGALLAVRKNFDIFGIAVLAEVTALGGGLFRDLVIGAVPPAAFTDLGYFLTPLLAAQWIAATVGIVLGATLGRRFRPYELALYPLMGWSVRQRGRRVQDRWVVVP